MIVSSMQRMQLAAVPSMSRVVCARPSTCVWNFVPHLGLWSSVSLRCISARVNAVKLALFPIQYTGLLFRFVIEPPNLRYFGLGCKTCTFVQHFGVFWTILRHPKLQAKWMLEFVCFEIITRLRNFVARIPKFWKVWNKPESSRIFLETSNS